MMTQIKSNITSICVFALSLLSAVSMPSYGEGGRVVGWHGGNYHGHGGGYGYGHGYGYGGGGGGYYDRGGFFFGWGGPNVIINVPAERYYAPPPIVCENVEVCNRYDECWLERQCG
ncbi:hypothetical protein [Legionella maioricensis]|uniref:Glycine-rich protein n=1 Tax=Legionella maioricensis TaxID=2896528 RepID=A0A9X2IDG1_9GAMM|nr:hypothetical protein [Legionella maioricensis]MCL9685492.1 hypothetical protein [Legionella maioricensis]MCL9688800.1 hypothetical protein [Legionella maioricensis]